MTKLQMIVACFFICSQGCTEFEEITPPDAQSTNGDSKVEPVGRVPLGAAAMPCEVIDATSASSLAQGRPAVFDIGEVVLVLDTPTLTIDAVLGGIARETPASEGGIEIYSHGVDIYSDLIVGYDARHLEGITGALEHEAGPLTVRLWNDASDHIEFWNLSLVTDRGIVDLHECFTAL